MGANNFYFNGKQFDEAKRKRIEENAARILSSESSEKMTDEKIAKVVENAVKMSVYLSKVVDGDVVIGEPEVAVEQEQEDASVDDSLRA